MTNKTNSNLWTGKFKEKELKLYENLKDDDIKIILDYQKLLPCLQEDNEAWIDARVLYEQLKVKSKFTDWIKEQLDEIDAIENENYSSIWLKQSVPFKENAIYSPQKMASMGYSLEYKITVDIAKQISMIAGVKGGRTNKELKRISGIARKYFISIEKAFKSRYDWNKDRMDSITAYHDLKKIVFADMYSKENKLSKYIPTWWNQKTNLNGRYIKNNYSYELYLLGGIA